MKISGETMYDLLRYAYKNDIFDDEKKKKEVRDAFKIMRDDNYQCGIPSSDYECTLLWVGPKELRED